MENKNNEKKKPMQIINKFARYSSLAFEMGIIILLFAFGGRYLDKKFEFQKPIITAIACLLAVVISILLTIKQLKNDKEKKSN